MTKRLRLALAAVALTGLLCGGCEAYPANPTYGYGYGYGYPGPIASGGYLSLGDGWDGGGWHHGWRHHGWHGGGWHRGWHGGGLHHGWRH